MTTTASRAWTGPDGVAAPIFRRPDRVFPIAIAVVVIAPTLRRPNPIGPVRRITHHPSSIIHHPSSIIHHPSSIIHKASCPPAVHQHVRTYIQNGAERGRIAKKTKKKPKKNHKTSWPVAALLSPHTTATQKLRFRIPFPFFFPTPRKRKERRESSQ